MNIFDKAKDIQQKVFDKSAEFSSDEIIADVIIKAVEKQEKVNAILKEKGFNYIVSDLDLSMGIPPTITFGIRRISTKPKKIEQVQVDNPNQV